MSRLISVDCTKIDNSEVLGSRMAGWYTPLDILNSESICYCFGAGEDVSFDCSLIRQFGCEVFTFDQTPRATAHIEELISKTLGKDRVYVKNDETTIDQISRLEVYKINREEIEKLNYYNIGVWSQDMKHKFFFPKRDEVVSCSVTIIQNTEDYFEAQCLTLSSIMKKFEHTNIDLLKMDIEGAEYEVVNSMIASNIRPKILGLEFHFDDRKSFSLELMKIRNMIKSIRLYGMVPVFHQNFDMVFLREDCI